MKIHEISIGKSSCLLKCENLSETKSQLHTTRKKKRNEGNEVIYSCSNEDILAIYLFLTMIQSIFQ